MSTKTKERKSKGTYRQCTLRLDPKPGVLTGHIWTEYVAWLPSKMVQIGKHVLIDSQPGRWLIVDAGEKRPAYIVEAYAENARKGFESVTGHEEYKKTGK